MPESSLQRSPGIASRLPGFRQLHKALKTAKNRAHASEPPSKFINARILKDDMRGYTKMSRYDARTCGLSDVVSRTDETRPEATLLHD